MHLEAKDICKVYHDTAVPVDVLEKVGFTLNSGEVVGISGPSGSGKSTFLHIIGGIDRPSKGVLFIDGEDVCSWNEEQLASFRNRRVGFVFQFYHLLKEFTVLENVMLPALIAGLNKTQAKEKALVSIEEVGLKERILHFPSTISGGEQQRVAIARAAVMMPDIILADEPTGNLDEENGKIVMDYLMKLNRDQGMSIVIVSHNEALLNSLPKRYELKEKKLSPRI